MTLPSNFLFSQNKLQDYFECPQRFELRHLKKLPWPAVQSEPVMEIERHIRMGERFHRLIHQYQLGIPTQYLDALAAEPPLHDWWQAFLTAGISDLPAQRLPEFTLTVPFHSYRLMAKFDLLAIGPDRVVIVDWKTGKRPKNNEKLLNRAQSMLYPLVFVLAGSYLLNGKTPVPEQIEMIYWFAQVPSNAACLHYSQRRYQNDLQAIAEAIDTIASTAQGSFAQASDEKECTFCGYRSRCNRGIQAANWDQADDWEDFEQGGFSIDFDQIEMLEY